MKEEINASKIVKEIDEWSEGFFLFPPSISPFVTTEREIVSLEL